MKEDLDATKPLLWVQKNERDRIKLKVKDLKLREEKDRNWTKFIKNIICSLNPTNENKGMNKMCVNKREMQRVIHN